MLTCMTPLATAISAGATILCGATPHSAIWQIGRFDDSPAEFALWPRDARRFKERFPQAPVFRIGENTPRDWPFIHPNRADTAWARDPLHRFTILFHLDAVPAGDPVLILGLYDLHERLPAVLHVEVNGREVFSRRLPKGAGQAYYGRTRHQSHRVAIPLGNTLRTGENTVHIWLTDGSWIAYDALALCVAPPLGRLPERPAARCTDFDAAFLPLHPDSARFEAWQAREIACSLREGWIVLTALGDAPRWIGPDVRDGMFDIEFDLFAPDAELRLGFVPEHGYGPAWQCRFASGFVELQDRRANLPGAGCMHVRIQHRPTRVMLRVERDGKTVSIEADRAPVHAARLEFRPAGPAARVAVTNVRWTVPIAVAPVRREGRIFLRVTAAAAPGPGRTPPVRITVACGDRKVFEGVRTIPCRADDSAAVLPAVLPPASTVGVTIESPPDAPRFIARRRIETEPAAAHIPDLPKDDLFVVKREDGHYAANKAWIVRFTADAGPDLLIDRASGEVWADGYLYRFAAGPVVTDPPVVRKTPDQIRIVLRGRQGRVSFVHTITLDGRDGKDGRLTENIEICNHGDEPVDLSDCRCGFLRTALRQGLPAPVLSEKRFIAAPLVHDPLTPEGRDEEFSITEILCEEGAWHSEQDPMPRAWSRDHGSEGWLVQDADRGVLVLKYNNRLLEWSLVGPASMERRTVLVFGGAGGRHGDPQELASIPAGGTFAFGTTVLIPYNGGPREGLYAFRRFMDAAGHGCPQGFDPPVHWNEIYDNKLWWGVGDTVENRRKFYRLEDILWEAQKAAEAHCEALYLDPGWDTRFGTHVWAADRLLDCAEFCQRMRKDYGLSVSLHTPMAQWQTSGGGGTDFPPEAWRMDEHGKRLHGKLCSCSKAYIEEETRRLLALCRAGVRYLMFDGSAPTGPCFDPDHGHPLPPSRSDHARALAVIAQNIHREFPDVIIEQHDQVTAGRPIAYCPHYFLHVPLDEGPRKQSWTERWGYEFMWNPMQDLLSGRARALYYYNLAYSLPMYLHIDLRPDNENCLTFWWYASTCRHLGIGGTHPDGRNWTAVRHAMALYRRLEAFFKRGAFYGLDEDVHVHTLGGLRDYRKPDEETAGLVFVLFNTTRRKMVRRVSFAFREVGLSGKEDWIRKTRWYGPAEAPAIDAQGGRFAVVLPPLSPAVIVFSPDVK